MPCPKKHARVQSNCRWCQAATQKPNLAEKWFGTAVKDRVEVKKRSRVDLPIKNACVHLGAPTGDTVLCSSCKGKVELKIFECDLHEKCTLSKKVSGFACCPCPDYKTSQ